MEEPGSHPRNFYGLKTIYSLRANKKHWLPHLYSVAFGGNRGGKQVEAAGFSAHHSLCLPCGLGARPRRGTNWAAACGGGKRRQPDLRSLALTAATGFSSSSFSAALIGEKGRGEEKKRCMKKCKTKEKLRLTGPGYKPPLRPHP